MAITRRTLLQMGSAACAASLAAPALGRAPITIRFSHIVAAEGHPKGEAARWFADQVADRLGGEVVVEIYPNGTLFNDEKVLEAMVLGDVQLAAPSLSKFETLTKVFRLFDLPFLFEDETAIDRFQDGLTGQRMLGELDRHGFKGLAYWRNGLKQLSANRPLLWPEDARGLKFRIQPSDVIQAQFEALGANPQKMAYPEVYGALQTGVVDGQENTWTNIWKSKFWEVQEGFTASNHGVIDYAVVADARFWGQLPGDVRVALESILAEATAMERRRAAELDAQSRGLIEAQGVPVRELTPEQRQAWIEAMQPVWDRFRGEIGEDIVAAVAG